MKAKLRKALKQFGVLLWQYWPVPRGYGMATLDCLLCVNGYFIAVETKTPGNVPTPRQEATIRDLRASGARVFVVDSDSDIALVVDAVKELLNGTSTKTPRSPAVTTR